MYGMGFVVPNNVPVIVNKLLTIRADDSTAEFLIKGNNEISSLIND